MCSRECPSHARETAARSRVHSTPSHRSSAQQLPPEWQSLALRFWALIGEPIFRPDSAVLKCLIACLWSIKCRPEARSRGESWERSGVRLLWPLGGTLTSELCVCERDWRQKSLMFIFKWKKMMDNRYDSSNGSVCVCEQSVLLTKHKCLHHVDCNISAPSQTLYVGCKASVSTSVITSVIRCVSISACYTADEKMLPPAFLKKEPLKRCVSQDQSPQSGHSHLGRAEGLCLP